MTCARERVPTNLTFCQQEVNECNNSKKNVGKKVWCTLAGKLENSLLTNCGSGLRLRVHGTGEKRERAIYQPQQKAFYGNL